MTARLRIVGLIVAGALLVLVLLAVSWTPLTTGTLEGVVYFTAGGGAAPPNYVPPPSSSPTTVDGAIVYAVRGQSATWAVVPQHRIQPASGWAASVRADASGRYRLDLAPGTYVLGAVAQDWVRTESDGLRTPPLTTASFFRQVRVARWETANLNVVIMFEAA